MLTGNEVSLEPYKTGKASIQQLTAQLDADLADDAEASRRLNAVVAAGESWVSEIAEPQIAARRAGFIPPNNLRR